MLKKTNPQKMIKAKFHIPETDIPRKDFSDEYSKEIRELNSKVFSYFYDNFFNLIIIPTIGMHINIESFIDELYFTDNELEFIHNCSIQKIESIEINKDFIEINLSNI